MRLSTNRKLIHVLGSVLASLAIAGVCSAGIARAESKSPTLTIGYFKGPNPETVGQQQGLFASNLHFSTVESGVTAFQEMIGGSLQIAGGIAAPPLALAVLKSMPLKIIYIEYLFRQQLVANSAIKRPEDLVGKTVAVTTGTTSDEAFDAYLKKSGLDPASIKTINMSATPMLSAFKRGNIAAGYIWDPVRSAMLAVDGHALDTTDPFAAVVASDAAIKRYPEAIQAYICALAKANNFVVANHGAAVKIFASLLNDDQVTAEQMVSARKYLSPNDNMTKWMGDNAANLTNEIDRMMAWANTKTLTPVNPVPSPHSIIDTSFITAAANGACK